MSAQLKQERLDAALKEALYLHDFSEARWRKLIEAGASDPQISHALTDEFGAGSGGSSQTAEDGIQFAYRGLPEPRFWIDAGSPHDTQRQPTLAGKKLVARVREVLKIPAVGPHLPDDLIAAGWSLREYRNGTVRAQQKGTGLATITDPGLSAVVANARFLTGRRVALSQAAEESEAEAGDATPEADAPPVVEEWDGEKWEPKDAEEAPEPRVFTKEIEVELTDADYKVKSRIIAHKKLEIEELQAEKKRTDDHYKQKIGGLEEEYGEVLRELRAGRATLTLSVYEVRDYERKVVVLCRADNGAAVEERAMRPAEFQQPLPTL